MASRAATAPAAEAFGSDGPLSLKPASFANIGSSLALTSATDAATHAGGAFGPLSGLQSPAFFVRITQLAREEVSDVKPGSESRRSLSGTKTIFSVKGPGTVRQQQTQLSAAQRTQAPPPTRRWFM